MVIYVYPDGKWEYEWESEYELGWHVNQGMLIRVDLDRLWSYKDLTPLQIKACEEALSE